MQKKKTSSERIIWKKKPTIGQIKIMNLFPSC